MSLDKRPARVAGMFDAIAARYDFLNHLLSAGFDRGWRRRAIRSLRLRGGERVVDVCTGTGDVALEAAHTGAGQVLGVDFAGEMLRLGVVKARDRKAGAGRVWLVRGDATRLPAASGSADATTAAFGIRNVEDPIRALAEMFRVLKPGGRLAILEFSIPRSRLVRALYLPYFRHVLPRIGRLVSGHGSAYTYLPVSVGAFIPPDVMCRLLGACGFNEVRATPLTFGVVTLYTAARP
ncbi:MAG: bifunctional demethylmenaquinone methyltransferase/2-methoxy-6-polyprenyl-1,4-benzoquinol methylase UbiE [Acidobacteria bacterium]|nr:MAG: bifunctional demethylmenaquinone methyltransferase/2-methoxy-6-polyprenyl-1,4-benzoquinol methylase UbiE [Acidobacteriota bacterium]RPJ76178.1 MAG: bifunctional demethylmenaquinone methyltransferase/2-methoxy-6-polyprenyl-1,4-benzoquinol methylase UbiE [Acidobacteriota bacterium]